ncbi:MAG: hypothetical protein J6B50_11420 [Lachnospiraceae bacterium]|nr:hypothetical protein [Lachnospiraceae bacterium]MBP3595234.1 hypothetical protein [Lachnospiraceae bacterium]
MYRYRIAVTYSRTKIVWSTVNVTVTADNDADAIRQAKSKYPNVKQTKIISKSVTGTRY